MKTPLVSIIVPVYNTGKYLPECLDSLCNQTYAHLDIVCIDDGSFDESYSILLEYSAKDARIQVASQKNAGQSAARNKALSMSKGEFILFVDSDDYLICDAVQRCVDALATGVDGVIFNADTFRDYFEPKKIIREYEELIINKYRGSVIPPIIDVRGSEHVAVFTNACQLFVPKKQIADNGIEFITGKIFEDSAFCAHVLSLSKKMYWIEEPLYFYRQHATSTLTSTGTRFLEAFEMFALSEQYFRDAGIWNQVEYCYYERYLGHLVGFWYRSVKNSGNVKLVEAYIKGLSAFVNKIPLLILYSVLPGYHWDKIFLLEMRDDVPKHIYAGLRRSYRKGHLRRRVKDKLRLVLIKLSPHYRLLLDTREKVNYVAWRVDQMRNGRA